MSCLNCLIFNLGYYIAVLGYPAYMVTVLQKEQKNEKIWLLYFFFLGVLSILECTALFPIKWLFCKIGLCCIWCVLKFLFCLWMYYPKFQGALLLEQILGKYLDMGYNAVVPIASKVTGLIGFPVREVESAEKKTQ